MATHSTLLPGESNGQRSLAGYSSQGRKQLDMTNDLACVHTHRDTEATELAMDDEGVDQPNTG